MNDGKDLRPWLPDALPPEGHPDWDEPLGKVLAAAEPELVRLARDGGVQLAPWLSEMGSWWRPAAGLAAAAVAFLLLTSPTPSPGSADPDAMSLTILASGADPAAIWAAMGVDADPVLALLTLEDHTADSAPAAEPGQGGPR